ncbi:MAG: phosphoglycerate dehydrogenase [Candidatus Omnitrophica bacterium]|nr:phosphoglycerate dehydrogenase [Candidatus Omnitrophota bacterium]
MTKILVTTTSFQDTPGEHHAMLESQGFDITCERGPLPESRMLELVGGYEGILCGDDAFTRKVLEKCRPTLRVLSKYGIGVDKIDLQAATDYRIPVTYCPGVNHTTVAEHTFGLILASYRQIPQQNAMVHQGQWKRMTGHGSMGQTLGILGLGRIGKEVAKRASAFGMRLIAFDPYWDDLFASQHSIEQKKSIDEVLLEADIVALHMNLTSENREFLNAARISRMKKGALVVNTSRGALVDQKAVAEAVKSGQLSGYVSDVVEPEPISPDCPFLGVEGIILTPHIGSRTYESVVRQATMAVENLVRVLKGEQPLAQANVFK